MSPIMHAGAAGLYGLEIHPVPYDGARMTIDLDRLREEAKRLRPKLITVAGSFASIPIRCGEVRQIADEVGAYVLYDAAHMCGMIAGERFQQPLAEGAHHDDHVDLQGVRRAAIGHRRSPPKRNWRRGWTRSPIPA